MSAIKNGPSAGTVLYSVGAETFVFLCKGWPWRSPKGAPRLRVDNVEGAFASPLVTEDDDESANNDVLPLLIEDEDRPVEEGATLAVEVSDDDEEDEADADDVSLALMEDEGMLTEWAIALTLILGDDNEEGEVDVDDDEEDDANVDDNEKDDADVDDDEADGTVVDAERWSPIGSCDAILTGRNVLSNNRKC